MKKILHLFLWGFLTVWIAFLGGCRPNQHTQRPSGVDLALRAHVDNYNKAAFLNRYDDPSCAIHEAYCALELLHDSLPNYYDGLLRAYNNLAFGYYMLAEQDSAQAYIDSVLTLSESLSHPLFNKSNNITTPTQEKTATSTQKAPQPIRKSGAKNAEVEQLIAQLMRIRLLQRNCRIAESYQLLYDIDQSRVLKLDPNNYLYSYAQMEYFITSLTLNYHYRNSALASSSSTLLTPWTKQAMKELLEKVEETRPHLKCDYAEDMSLNYAMAHCYYRLASASNGDPKILAKAYDNLASTLRILAKPNQYSIYHLANVFQLQAFIVADTDIAPEMYYERCNQQLKLLDSLSWPLYPVDSLYLEGEYGLDMFRISTDLFFRTTDPYQHLGAVVAAAEYCLRIHDYDEAYRYYTLILNDTSWNDGIAPKFESMLYDGLIRMGYSDDPVDNANWYAREMELQNFIRENESADVMLQDRLDRAENRNKYYAVAIIATIPFLIILSILVLLLVNRSRRLRDEKTALQEAKRQDVERIANVETCLSVMRHDVNPFLSYLQNKKLSPEMRQEVLDQLLRTFANIKNWTNLSIPSGLQFQPSVFPLNEVFDSVAGSCARLDHEVDLIFYPTTLKIMGDRQLTEILLRNLVNNALQHTLEGKVTIYAELYDKDNRFVHIEVDDTGQGMDEETLENLFRADKKVSPTTNSDAPHGTGFGLILCKYIIKRHDDNTLRGCRIWAESELGKGSTFHFILAGSDNDGWTADPWREKQKKDNNKS